MPSPVTVWLVPTFIIVIASVILLSVQKGCFGIRQSIQSAHTSTLFQQFYAELEKSKGHGFPETREQLYSMLGNANIDWNSCSLENGKVLDGWKRPITVEFDESNGAWFFFSAGGDGEFGTADDIAHHFPSRQAVEP